MSLSSILACNDSFFA
jgi:hypothetical protein